LLNGAGKTGLTARSKVGGFGGMRLRVKIDAKKAAGGKKDGDAAPFTVTVEEQGKSGWRVKEVLREVTLTEIETDEGKEIRVAYQFNRPSDIVDIVVPEGKKSLADLQPSTQEQTLSIEQRMLAPPKLKEFQGDVTMRTGLDGLEGIDDITMVVVPDLMSVMPNQKMDLNMVKAVQTAIIAHCEKMADRVAILDTPPDLLPQEVNTWRMETTGFDSSYAAMYYPWIEIMDPVTDRPMHIPPSGHIAGVWARNDNTRGVHKAPANEVVRGATGLAYGVGKGEQDVLNPNAVNCIRAFPGMGIRVWGARTLSSNPAWRYINVRRLFNYIEKSIERGTQWVVFEPNEPRLWGQVRRDVGAFLTMVWRDGALFGASPGDAFYVKCDNETNPPEGRDLGQLVVEIGVAPVKPAEFVIFRISQWSPELG
jgi:phage tail sheath protein FI